MRRLTYVIVLGSLLIAPWAATAAEGDQDKLQGVWRRVSGMENGKRMSATKAKGVTLTITGSRFTITRGDQTLNDGVVRLDTESMPAVLDLAASERGNEGSVLRGIYKFEGERLVTCVARAGAARPTRFEARAGSGRSLMTWVRETDAVASKESPREEPPQPASEEESPLTVASRLQRRLPGSSPPIQVIVGKSGPQEFEVSRFVTAIVPVTEVYDVNVGGKVEKRQRTGYKNVHKTVMMKMLTKHLRVWTEDGKLVEVEPQLLPSLLRKGEPILMAESPNVDLRHMEIYKPGTAILVPPEGPPPPPPGAPNSA